MQQLHAAPFREKKIAFTRSSCGGSVPDSFIARSAEHQSPALFLSARKRKPLQTEICRGSYREPGDDLLSLEIQPTIIGAEAFHCPVRNGKEWDRHAMVTRLKGGRKSKALFFRAAMQSLSNSLEVFFELSVQGFTVIGSSFTSN